MAVEAVPGQEVDDSPSPSLVGATARAEGWIPTTGRATEGVGDPWAISELESSSNYLRNTKKLTDLHCTLMVRHGSWR